MRLIIILLQVAIAVIGTDGGVDLPGHMQPIGSHRPSEDDITVLSYVPDPLEFYEEYISLQKPVLLKGAISSTPAAAKWISDEYLSNTFGKEGVGFEIGKKEDRGGKGGFTTMKDFLKRYKEEDIYLINDMPEGMQREWQVPRCLLCGGYTENLNFCYIWFSSGGTKSVLHTDSYENLHCLASGIKEFVLIEPGYAEVIGPEHKELGYYHIDVERVNMTSYPGMMRVPWYHVRVESGDCLYLPYKWIHHVSSHDRNLGVNIWWGNFKFRRDKCPPNMADVPDFMSLSEFNLWLDKQIVPAFLSLMRDDGYIYAEDLAAHKLTMYDQDTVREMLEILDPGCDGRLLGSKLAEDGIPQERYSKLEDFVEWVDEQQESHDPQNEFFDLPDNGAEAENDDIEVPSREDVMKFVEQHSKKAHSGL